MQLRQQGRPVRVQTKLGADAVVVERMVAEEFVSAPFRITLDLLSLNASIETKKLLRTAVVVEMDFPGGVRLFHGMVSRCSQGGRMGEITRYRCEVVPQLAYAGLSNDNRVFQLKSVPDIVEEVLKGAGVEKFTMNVKSDYPKREFCVQYGESNLQFMSRLLENEGIFFYHKYTNDGHELVIGDQNSVFYTPEGGAEVRFAGQEAGSDSDVVLELLREDAVHVGKVTLRDYNYLEPSSSLVSTVEGSGDGAKGEEVYEYPGGFTTRSEGDRLARLRLEAAEALEHTVHGRGSVRTLTAGGRFTLSDHFDQNANKEYVCTSARHIAVQAGWRAGESEAFSYENTFTAIPFSVPYRPQLNTPRTRMPGMQTGVVVGPKGEEIHTDAHGRVKVHFHWDRLGTKDEKSSCWVRVSSAWAGKGYGSLSLPRIGQEVIVDFLESDPDRPIITGRVYNAEQTPPADPGGKGGVVSGFRTKTHKGSGYNEMTLDDTAGKEKITIHAQYDMDTSVEHDDTQTVKNNRTVKITDGNLSEDVVAGTSTTHVKGAVVENYDATQATTVKNDITIVSQSGPIAIAADSQHVYVKGTTNIQLKCGESMIWMDAGGQITIEGINVTIKGKAALTLKGGMVHSEADSQHQTKGAIVMSEGSATNTIKGGMVMLNP